jgi:hypothetical protein
MAMEKKIKLNFLKITKRNAWLLGFIYADGLIRTERGKKVVKIYNKSYELLKAVKEYYQLPYEVIHQKNSKNIVYLIRISDQVCVNSIVNLGFQEDKTDLLIPQMDDASMKMFLKGFLKGKGSYFQETKREVYGFRVIYRSKSLINNISIELSKHSNVKLVNTYYRKIKNVTSCEIKYLNFECDKINIFLQRYQIIFDNIL